MSRNVPTVLFADHDLEWSRPLRGRLRERGVRVMMAESLDEALEAVRYYGPELVVLDAGLAGIPEGKAISTIRIRSPYSRIVLMSGEPLSNGEELCHRLGLAYYGVKSLETGSLLSILLFALGSPPAPATG